jgi:hypothetical protein
MEELIQAERRIMTDSVATALGRFHGLAYSIMHDCVCAHSGVGAQRTEGSRTNEPKGSVLATYFMV